MSPLTLLLAAALAADPIDEAARLQAGPHLDARLVELVRALEPRVATLRGLPFTRPVGVAVQDAETVRARIEQEDMDAEARDLLSRAQRSLAAFHLAARDLDLVSIYLDLMGAQLGGFYDPEDRELVLVRRGEVFASAEIGEASEEEAVAAHELVHALQDQHFDLWHLQHRDWEDDDVATAVSSLVEGDASFAMAWFEHPDLADVLDTAELQATESLFSDLDDPGPLGRAPRVVRDNVYFPYTAGLEFAQAVKRAGGWAGLDAAFARPPLSTEQILHPGKYLSDTPDWPTRLELPDLPALLGPGWSVVDENTLGEMGIRSVLHQHLPAMPQDVRAATAAGWDGDRYVVLEHHGGALAAAWVSTWDSPTDAAEFGRMAERWAARVCEGDDPGTVSRLGRTFDCGSTVWHVGSSDRDVIVLLDVPPARVRALQRALSDLPRRELRTVDDVAPVKDEPRAAP